MFLQEINIVDLKNSKWDREKSDPTKGKYVFLPNKKRYIDYRGDSGARPPFKFIWNRYNPYSQPPYKDIAEWQAKWKCELVKASDEDYWPEGVMPNQDGAYTNGDVILMKMPLEEYLQKRKREIMMSEQAPKRIMAQFKSEARSVGLELKDEDLEKALAR
jgi:hypothetical protein